MIRILSPFLILLFFTGTITAQVSDEPEKSEIANLFGKVKSISESSYLGRVSGKEYIKGPKGWQYSWLSDSRTELDSNGNIVKKIYFDNLAKPTHTDEFKFEKGKLVLSQTAEKSQAFEYDSLKRISREVIVRKKNIEKSTEAKTKNGESSLVVYTYTDQNLQPKQKLHYDLSDQLIMTEDFRYDAAGNLTFKCKNMVMENEKDSMVFNYDLQNKLIRMEWYNEAGKLMDRTSYKYVNGKKTHMTWEDFKDGIPDGTVEIEYNAEKGNEKEVIDVEANGAFAGKESNIYTYDKTGNWTRKVTIVDDEDIFIVERRIEYYSTK